MTPAPYGMTQVTCGHIVAWWAGAPIPDDPTVPPKLPPEVDPAPPPVEIPPPSPITVPGPPVSPPIRAVHALDQLRDVEVVFPNDTTALLTYHVKQGVASRGAAKSKTEEMADLYDVQVRPVAYHDGVVDIEVLTRDSWSLDPGVSAGRSGGTTNSGAIHSGTTTCWEPACR